MIIKQTNELEFLASEANKSVVEFSEQLVSLLEQNGIVSNDPDFYGAKINEVCNPTVKEFATIVSGLGLPTKGRFLTMVYNLVLFGTDDCPECGGELVEDEERSVYKHISGDYFNPDEWVLVNGAIKCTCCEYLG